MKVKKRKLLSILLSLAMVIGLMPAMSLTAWADSAPVYYIDASGAEVPCMTYTVVTGSNSDVTWSAGWYVVNDNVTINGKVNRPSGDVNLILCDGKTLTVNTSDTGIDCDWRKLTIYAQSGGTGKLVVTSETKDAISNFQGSMVIHGGDITAIGGTGGLAIASSSVKNAIPGTGWIDSAGTGAGTEIAVSEKANVTSYKKVHFVKSSFSYLDENGDEQSCASYTIVNTDINTSWNPGWYVVNGDVTISNRIIVDQGTVNLILRDGATLTASKGITVAKNRTLNIYEGWTGARASTPTVGMLIATGDTNTSGIGGDTGSDSRNGGTVTINGVTVNATGSNYAAGIGGGYGNGSGCTVTINNGTVTATGGENGVGIGGGGSSGAGGTLTINGGTVTANGGSAEKAGIGGGGSEGTIELGTGVRMQTSTDNINWSDYDGTRAQYMKSTYTPHVHNFTFYTANGNTITATCGADGCPLDNNTATLTIVAPTAGGGEATLTGASDFGVSASDIEYSSDNGGTWSPTAPSGNGFYQACITVASSYNATVSYGVNAITAAVAENGSIDVPTIATVGADITVNTTPNTGYELDTLTVTKDASSGTVAVTKNGNDGSFTMPAENVTVNATFKKINYTITVANNITNGEVSANKTTANYQDTVTLTATPAAGYALDTITVKDSENQTVAVSNNQFTMPASNVTITATFNELEKYTIFYRASGSPESVLFKMTADGAGNNMTRSAKLGNIDCWAIQISAAGGKTSFPVAFSTDGGSTWSDLDDRSVVEDIPGTLAEGSAVIVKGDAKAFILSFLWGDIAEDADGSYQAESGKSKNFLVTNNTTSVTLAAPTKSGYSFLGFDDGKSANLKSVSNGTVDINGTNETTIFAARWEQINCNVTYNLNGGSGNAPQATVTYGNKVTAPANPTKDGYSFAGWVVAKSATEKINGKETKLSAGTAFNFSDTEIINDIVLKAEWKHVHSYACLQLNDSVFGGAFSSMSEYAPYVHIKICTRMDDYAVEAHRFDSNGKCACGATKPTPTVTLQKTIDNALESTSQVIKNSVVAISAPQTKNAKQFAKWQYYSGNGSYWYDLSTSPLTAFAIPSDLQVRAVYQGSSVAMTLQSFNYSGNIAFSFSYKVPDGYTVVDGGILYGNNAHIRYMDAKQLVANVSGMADVMFPYIPSVEMPVHYDPAKGNAVDKFGAENVANKMFAEQAINVSGNSTPLFKKLPAFGKTGQTAIAINSSAGNIYYYGVGYLICKDPNGSYVPFVTNAIEATKDNPYNGTRFDLNI